MIADPDFAMCCQMLEKSRDSRVLSLVTTGIEAMDIRLCPAWMIVSMQYEKSVTMFSRISDAAE